jgi:antitoxin (DNA-binding transcriptional repressor) of toxin-antitoxin stability system
MTYTLQQAQTNLARLLSEAEEGKEVVIERDAKPALRLIVVKEKTKAPQVRQPRIPGQYAGKFQYSDDWWKPLETEDQLREYGFDIMIDNEKPDESFS